MGLPQAGAKGAGHFQQGFTLLEVLVAVIILGLAYVAVLQSFSQSGANIARLEKGVTAEMHEAEAVEQRLREGDVAGEELVTGQKFVLRKIGLEEGLLETVKLEKRLKE